MRFDICTAHYPVLAAVVIGLAAVFLRSDKTAKAKFIDGQAKKWQIDLATANALWAPARHRAGDALQRIAFICLFGLLTASMLVYAVEFVFSRFGSCTSLVSMPDITRVMFTALLIVIPAAGIVLSLARLIAPRQRLYSRRLYALAPDDLPAAPVPDDFKMALAVPAGAVMRLRITAVVIMATCAAGLAWLIWRDAFALVDLGGNPNAHHARAYSVLKSIQPDILLFMRAISLVIFVILGPELWQLATGNSKAFRTIALNWSLTSRDMSVLFQPRNGLIYCSLTWVLSASVIGSLFLAAAMSIVSLITPTPFLAYSTIMAACLSCLALGVATATLRLILCPRSWLYIRTLSSELRQQIPQAGKSAFDIAAGIDLREISGRAWQTRLLGAGILLTVFATAFVQLTPLAALLNIRG